MQIQTKAVKIDGNSCEYERYPFSFLLLEEQEKEADPVERDVQEEGEVIEIEEDMETPAGDCWP